MTLPGSAMRGSNRNQLGSNAITVVNQGGGNKKAGLPYQVGRESWSTIALGGDRVGKGKCCNLKQRNTLAFTNRKVSQSRPVGGDVTISYWH
jgi:hypothetical protein